MEVFNHHIYEYKKGLRNLILHTACKSDREKIIERLERNKIAYVIHDISPKKINVFFGCRICIDVINRIEQQDLSQYTDEQDFILGSLLGYDLVKQCERYLNRKNKAKVGELIG